MDNEVFSPIYGFKFGKFYIGFLKKLKEGTPSSVSFDAAEVLKNIKRLVGFYHTHPTFASNPSYIDRITMEAWCLAKGEDLLCIIESISDDTIDAWWYSAKDDQFGLGFCKFLFGRRFVIGVM